MSTLVEPKYHKGIGYLIRRLDPGLERWEWTLLVTLPENSPRPGLAREG